MPCRWPRPRSLDGPTAEREEEEEQEEEEEEEEGGSGWSIDFLFAALDECDIQQAELSHDWGAYMTIKSCPTACSPSGSQGTKINDCDDVLDLAMSGGGAHVQRASDGNVPRKVL